MRKNKSLFFVPWLGARQEEDDLYRCLRDDPKGADFREHIEGLWKEYEFLATKAFLREVQINFHQRWWEMYLTVGMLHLSGSSGFKVETSKHDKGPDIKITLSDETRIWIEAVAPNPGSGNDRVPEHELDGVFDVPRDECLLRLAQGINEKKMKFQEYKEKNILNREDLCMIAISSCALNQFGHLLDFPCPAPLSVLAGAHQMVLSTRKPPRISKRQEVKKISGKSVPVCLFEESSADIISAILYSSEDPLNAPITPESTFKIFLNPNAEIPLPECFLNNIETWHREEADNSEVWKII